MGDCLDYFQGGNMADMLSTLDNVLSFIEDNITTAITTIEARHSITLTPYLKLEKYTPLGQQFPAISIHPAVSDEATIGAGNGRFFGNPSKRDKVVAIKVWARGNQTQSNTVETDVVGYMDVFEELFKSELKVSESSGVAVLETVYDELFPLDKETLLKVATLRIRVKYNLF